MRRRLPVLLALVLVLAVGCVAQEDRDLISTAAAAGQGNLREWETLTDAQKREDHQVLTDALVTLDEHINGRTLAPAGGE